MEGRWRGAAAEPERYLVVTFVFRDSLVLSTIFIVIFISAVAGPLAYYFVQYAPRVDFRDYLLKVFPNSEISFMENASRKRLVQIFEIRCGEKTFMAGYEGPIGVGQFAPDFVYLFVPSDQIVAEKSFDLYANTFFTRLVVPHRVQDCGLPLSVRKRFILSEKSFHGVASYLQKSNLIDVLQEIGEAKIVTRLFTCAEGNKNLYRRTPFGGFSGVGIEYASHLNSDLSKQLKRHIELLQRIVDTHSNSSS